MEWLPAMKEKTVIKVSVFYVMFSVYIKAHDSLFYFGAFFCLMLVYLLKSMHAVFYSLYGSSVSRKNTFVLDSILSLFLKG